MKAQIVGCQHQEDALQRKRVAQCTFLVHEHTQAFDGGHIRCRQRYVSNLLVITVVRFELPLLEFCNGDAYATLPIIPIPISFHMAVTA